MKLFVSIHDIEGRSGSPLKHTTRFFLGAFDSWYLILTDYMFLTSGILWSQIFAFIKQSAKIDVRAWYGWSESSDKSKFNASRVPVTKIILDIISIYLDVLTLSSSNNFHKVKMESILDMDTAASIHQGLFPWMLIHL